MEESKSQKALNKAASLVEQIRIKKDDYPVFQIRWDPQLSLATDHNKLVADASESGFFLLKIHLQHIQYALKYFEIPSMVTYETLLSALKQAPLTNCAMRVQLTFKKDATVQLDVFPAPPRPSLFSGIMSNFDPVVNAPLYRLFIDTKFTVPSPESAFRTTYQKHLDERKAAFQCNDPYDVLLINPMERIMTGCETNIAIFRRGKWVVPNIMDGGDCDAMRRFLLDHGLVHETTIPARVLSKGEEVLVFNTVIGVTRGIIMNDYVEVPKKKRKPKILKGRRASGTNLRGRGSNIANRKNNHTEIQKKQLGASRHIPGVNVMSWN